MRGDEVPRKGKGEGGRSKLQLVLRQIDSTGVAASLHSAASPFGAPATTNYSRLVSLAWHFCFSSYLAQASLARSSEKQKSRSLLRE